MNAITKLDQMIVALKGKKKKKLVVVNAVDVHTINAVYHAVKKEIVEGVLVGQEKKILKVCEAENINPDYFTLVDAANEKKAAIRSLEMIHAGEGDVIMKGLLSTDQYMRALLNKDIGLLPHGAILSHVSVLELKHYHKLLIVGDVAIIPEPELREKIAISEYLIQTAKALGISKPKLAVLAATEQVLPKLHACTDAAILSKMGERGQISGAFIDGPMGLDVAIDKESAVIKKVGSPVAGDADCLLFPNIEAGNVFYKAHTKLNEGELGAIVVGAKVPAILSSRGDSALTKLYSIALATITAR